MCAAPASTRADFASVHLQQLQGAIERTDVRAGTRRVLLLPLREMRDEEPGGAHRPDAEPAGSLARYWRDSVAVSFSSRDCNSLASRNTCSARVRAPQGGSSLKSIHALSSTCFNFRRIS